MREGKGIAQAASAARSQPLPSWESVEPDNGSGEEDQAWVTTYIDTLTLLLTLFVMLLAFANYDPKTYEQVTSALSEEAGGGVAAKAGSGGQTPAVGKRDDGDDSKAIAEGLSRALAENGMGEGASVTVEKGRVTLALRERVLFSSGEAELTANGYALLDRIAPALATTDHHLSVEGHTDDIPIANEYFPSNWELSSARATRVVRYLLEKGIDKTRLRAVGYADSRPQGDNATAEGRARNRRVSIVVHGRSESAEDSGGPSPSASGAPPA